MAMTDFQERRSLDPTARAQLLRAARVRQHRAREVIFHEGDPGEVMHLVASERLAVRATTPLGHLVILQLLDPGARRTASVIALEPSHTVMLSATAVAELRRPTRPSIGS